jgi:hypothetical protein
MLAQDHTREQCRSVGLDPQFIEGNVANFGAPNGRGQVFLLHAVSILLLIFNRHRWIIH